MNYPLLYKKECLQLFDDIKSDDDAKQFADFFKIKSLRYASLLYSICILILSILFLDFIHYLNPLFDPSFGFKSLHLESYMTLRILIAGLFLCCPFLLGYKWYFDKLKRSLIVVYNVSIDSEVNDIITTCPDALIIYNNVLSQGRNFYRFDIDLIKHSDPRYYDEYAAVLESVE